MTTKPTWRELAETRAETVNHFAGEVARLRAANAELLEALALVMRHLPAGTLTPYVRQRARNAIAKATGDRPQEAKP